ncbi:MAG: hypothetical protein Q9197_002112 [Variospora fuerteventurae]
MDESQPEQVRTSHETPQVCISSGRWSREQDERNWRELFSSDQREDEAVEAYSARILALVDDLTDLPGHLKASIAFYRTKAGFREPIRRTLKSYVIQPTSHSTLNNMAMAIERDIEEDFSQKDLPLISQRTPQQGRRPDQGLPDCFHPFEQSQLCDRNPPREELQSLEPSDSHQDARHDHTQSTSLQIHGHSQTEGPLKERPKRGHSEDHKLSYDSASSLNGDFGASHPRLPPQEIHRRKSGNLCFYCGEPGHMKGECPQNPLKRQKRWR